MNLDIDKDDVKKGVLGLVIALVEIIRDILKLQAVRRMDGEGLTSEEIERLGRTLMELDRVIEEIKEDYGVSESVRKVRDSLDNLANGMVNNTIRN
ncbi:MAG: gas vesicle protein K [Deltaproteobacteria bacterium]|nr:gas vesicle protein K [Deltaproteobacteria bacterium]